MSETEDTGLPHDMKPADSFDAFFQVNEDKISEMWRSDSYDLLYAVWFGGYDYGLRTMTNFGKSLAGD